MQASGHVGTALFESSSSYAYLVSECLSLFYTNPSMSSSVESFCAEELVSAAHSNALMHGSTHSFTGISYMMQFKRQIMPGHCTEWKEWVNMGPSKRTTAARVPQVVQEIQIEADDEI